ncbi:DUF1254 domain-containing protein [Kitasatospora sp. NPDC093806]|uniref:DUF1254 domain-containing protein n=1 Tax=Kitasatospora sp. NPDC093806 TaxID=3155075 RepID=UPI0034334462
MVNPALVDPDTVRATAAEAWLRGHPILRNYRTLYAQALDDADPRHLGGFGRFRHRSRPYTPADTDPDTGTDPVAPDNDTSRSRAWLDLRTEPWVLSVPAADRYHVLPVHELDGGYAGFVGSRTTGREAGDHLVAGPDWHGEPPPGIRSVIRTATRLAGVLGRTQRGGTSAEDVAELARIQQGYRLRPLHEYAGTPEPEPAPSPVWPVWREEVFDTVEFLSFLDFLLGFVPVRPATAALRGRLADLGVDGRGEFEPAALPIAVRAEIERGIADGKAELARAAERAQARAADAGTFDEPDALPAEEVWHGGLPADSAGHRPPNAGDRDYLLRFPPDALPPARFLWSATMYALPDRRLVDNTLDRYAIGDGTPGLVRDPDGGLTLHLRHKRPANADHSANWLPAPDGPFAVVVRLYGPDESVLDGRWTLPPLTPR